MASLDPVQQAFANAKHSFRTKLKDPDIYRQILATRNINEVYDTTKKLQESAHGNGRHMMKIKPFLDGLERYAGVIETFVQVKPEIMALIWGPLKLLLLWSSELTSAQDKFTNTLVELGHAMPQLELMSRMSDAGDTLKIAMGLLFEDILDFYRISFDFFRKPYWKKMIDTLWASHLRKFNEVASNLRQHSTLLRHGVTLTDINEARQHRIQSLALLDETHKDQQRQKFASLRDRFSVNLYDERLDWIRNRSVAGCEKWLLEDSIFCSWKDVPGNGNQNTAWLWLQGIPGAGKTYICSAAIDHLRQDGQNQVLFAFLSHTYNVGQRALNVLQSFLFQAAEDDLDLQSVLIDARERELRGNTGYVVDLLKSWLQTAGPTYVVVDGLDEMDPIERKFLLDRLEELAKGSDALRFLVCSRLEADIRSELKERATVIQVNKRNSGSIQTYINSRFHDWVNKNRFDHNIRLELRQLLSPLSARAKGMFLFARIIIDGVEEISSLDEIRSELKAMPNDLVDAYQRIFQRINKLAPADREKRRKILGWIGCAPVPMTIYEMTQAISLHTSSEDSVPQDFLRLCGPLIEVVDAKLQFVHFTAQEYIFSKQIADFIDEKKATQDLVAMLLDYLDSDILELDADDNQIAGDILCGKYRLLQFAHFYLPTLLQRLNSDGPMPDVVGKQLDLLARGRKNHEFTVVVDSREPPYANDIDKSLWPIGYECARRTFQFHLDEKRWSWNRGNSEAWVNLDPLVTSKVLVRIQDLYEKLIHDDDSGKSMEYHYGPRLFKCTYLFCSSSRQGFETRHDRDTHVNHHERPYKCSAPNCIYYTLGFNTPRRCEEHLAEFHASKLILDNISNLTTVDLVQPLLFTLVMEGQSEDIERLLSSPGGKKLSPEILASARLTGAKRGSKAITNLLAPPDEKDVPWKIVEAAMKSQDAACVEYVVAGASTDDYSKLMKLALVIQSDDVYTIWEQHIINKVKNQELRVISEIFKQQVFRDIKGNALKETRLQHTLERLRKYLNRLMLGDLLVRVAKTSCSFAIAKQLLIYGAPVDHPRWTYPPNRDSGSREGSGMTALHAAAKKTDKDSAELVRHLMLLGAHTFDVNMEEQPCVKEMKALIGITWNDLLELVKQRLSH